MSDDPLAALPGPAFDDLDDDLKEKIAAIARAWPMPPLTPERLRKLAESLARLDDGLLTVEVDNG